MAFIENILPTLGSYPAVAKLAAGGGRENVSDSDDEFNFKAVVYRTGDKPKTIMS